jgi:hypothetical protein
MTHLYGLWPSWLISSHETALSRKFRCRLRGVALPAVVGWVNVEKLLLSEEANRNFVGRWMQCQGQTAPVPDSGIVPQSVQHFFTSSFAVNIFNCLLQDQLKAV